MHRVINKVLLSTIIFSIALFIVRTFMVTWDKQVIVMFFLFLGCVLCVSTTKRLIKLSEDQNAILSKFAEYKLELGKPLLPIVLLILNMAFMIMFVIKLITKSKLNLHSEYTFIIGIVLAVGMIMLIIIGKVKKEEVFRRENVQKYAYIYLNILVSLLLIVR